MKKPAKCKGCPLYGNGEGFVPDSANDSELTIALNHPSPEEVKEGESGYGGAWQEIKNRYLPVTGITDPNITHVIRCREWAKSQKKFIPWWLEKPVLSKVMKEAIKHCSTHDEGGFDERLIIAQGELGHYKYGGPAKDDAPYNWRGHLAPE